MKERVVIINEQHSLMENQKEVLNYNFGENWELCKIPSEGLNIKQMESFIDDMIGKTIIFASPIPYLLMKLSNIQEDVYIFHNDNRQKVELPNRKIIYKVAEKGWKLIN